MSDVLSTWKNAVDYLKSQNSSWPKHAVVLGSGLSDIDSHFQCTKKIAYKDIPGFHAPSVAGHGGHIMIGTVKGKSVLMLQGRLHFYEGHPWSSVVLPVRVLKGLGVESVLLTNAAGGLNTDMQPGDFMIITDQINLTGNNPLVGPNVPEFGPRFPDMSTLYDPDLTGRLASAFQKLNQRYFEGTYCGVLGPSYETAAEIRYLQRAGGGAVGMSTVAEAIAGRHIGLRVAGLSLITNLGTGLSKDKLDHKDVQRIGEQSTQLLFNVLANYL